MAVTSVLHAEPTKSGWPHARATLSVKIRAETSGYSNNTCESLTDCNEDLHLIDKHQAWFKDIHAKIVRRWRWPPQGGWVAAFAGRGKF